MRWCFEQFSKRPGLMDLPDKVVAKILRASPSTVRKAIKQFKAGQQEEVLPRDAGAIPMP